jgi:hypothetical protein
MSQRAVKTVDTRIFTKQAEKFNETLFAKKLITSVFWDRKGVLMEEFTQQGTTITSEEYCETLKTLRGAMQNKRRGILTSSVALLYDNAHPHTATHIRALLENFIWELFDHPPDSPDFAPSDYHPSIYLKNWLRSQSFNNNELVEGAKT